MTETAAAALPVRRTSLSAPVVYRNLLFGLLVLLGWLALETGYFTPDRPTRPQWERLQKAKSEPPIRTVYQSSFGSVTPGVQRDPAGYWGFYNGATVSTVQYDSTGVTVDYNGVSWIGAVMYFTRYEAQRVYRITIDRDVQGEPGAIIVRNRQMDLDRSQVPVGTGPFIAHFLAPRGRFDRVEIAFIPDNPGKPKGSMRITSLKIEQVTAEAVR